MAVPIRLLVGLGNPGEAYRLTRHNVGARWLEDLATRFNIPLKRDLTKKVQVGRGLVLGHDIRVLVPTTYMNMSGEAVGPYLRYFRIEPNEVLVAYDDVAFEVGKTRLKFGGGPSGHNGLRSLIKHFGGDQDFGRLRIGVGHPGNGRDMVAFLTQITMPEQERLDATDSSYLADETLNWLFEGDWQKAMTKLNSTPNPDNAAK